MWCTAVKRIIAKTHRRWGTLLTVIPVVVDDKVGELCRTFGVTCEPADVDIAQLMLTVHNYLNEVQVHSRLSMDRANKRIVVTVSSVEGKYSLSQQASVISRNRHHHQFVKRLFQ